MHWVGHVLQIAPPAPSKNYKILLKSVKKLTIAKLRQHYITFANQQGFIDSTSKRSLNSLTYLLIYLLVIRFTAKLMSSTVHQPGDIQNETPTEHGGNKP